MQKGTVVVGMSGGVDSSVSALLLKQQGYRVIGLFMKNWEEQDANGMCMSTHDYEDVVRVCEQIGIPHYSVNFVKEYWENVFEHALKDFQQGDTPNPDILCNREIKFKVLLEKAKLLQADFLATGHYSRIEEGKLLKGKDANKDQSYFLYAVSRPALKQVLFPIGNLQKSEVRKIAKQYGLATAEKKDSTGLCFVGERDFKQFLGNYIKATPGNFEDLNGNVLGQHDGVAFYTIGQRRGLGIGGPGDAWFVVHKDVQRNVVVLVQGDSHPALFCQELIATNLNWISIDPPTAPFSCTAKIRYRQSDKPCTVYPEGNSAKVIFDQPQRAVTPKQSIVFYDQDVCLGGGTIEKGTLNTEC